MTISMATINNEMSAESVPKSAELKKVSKLHSILLIESDINVSHFYCSHLEDSGYTVHSCSDIEQIKPSIIAYQPDMLILDVGFCGFDKLSIAEHIRTIFTGPVILLTSVDSEQEQISAFNAGVDDYLVKPISMSILSVRVSALFRRQPKQLPLSELMKVQVGDITLYPKAQKCQVKEKNIHLSNFEFKLLGLLLQNVGNVMSRDYIYKSLLGRQYNGIERTVDVRVSQLREKLALEGMRRTKIETVWGKGYILNEVVA